MIIINIAIKYVYKRYIFNIDFNMFTVIADFICSGILFQIGILSDKIATPTRGFTTTGDSFECVCMGVFVRVFCARLCACFIQVL